MLWSKLFIPTLRDEGQPLLTRAGYMRGPAYLYLAHRTLRKIEEIVRQEMHSIGAQEFGGGADLLALARELRSYRQLPQIWHRITESYSFELGDAGYQEHFIAYSKILGRCRVKYVAASGGFFPGEAPQDDSQGWQDPPGDLVPEEFYTPRQKTIADIAKFTGLPETAQMKSLVMVADGEPVLAVLRGDHQLSETKCAAVLGASEIRPARAEEIREWFGADAGSLGPVGLSEIRIIADEALRGRCNMICGANKNDYHLRHVTPGEDFEAEFLDLRQKGGTELAQFLRLSAHLPGLHVTNEEGRDVGVIVGRYTLDPAKILHAAAEQNRDQEGMALPPAIAPFAVIVTAVHHTQLEAARKIHEDLLEAGLESLLDDRDLRPGVKFKDADLIGIPYRINVGKKMAEGLVEVVERRSRQMTDAPAEKIAEHLNIRR